MVLALNNLTKVDMPLNKETKPKKEQLLGPYQRTKKAVIMRVTVTPNVIGPLGNVSKGLERGLEKLKIGGLIEIFQTTA